MWPFASEVRRRIMRFSGTVSDAEGNNDPTCIRLVNDIVPCSHQFSAGELDRSHDSTEFNQLGNRYLAPASVREA